MSSRQPSPCPPYGPRSVRSSQHATQLGKSSSTGLERNRERHTLHTAGQATYKTDVAQERYILQGSTSSFTAPDTYTRSHLTPSAGSFNASLAAHSGSQFDCALQGQDLNSLHKPKAEYLGGAIPCAGTHRPSSNGVPTQYASTSQDEGYTVQSNCPYGSNTFVAPSSIRADLLTTPPWAPYQQNSNPPYHPRSLASPTAFSYPYHNSTSLVASDFHDGREGAAIPFKALDNSLFGTGASRHPLSVSRQGISPSTRSTDNINDQRMNPTASFHRRPSTPTSITTTSLGTQNSRPSQSAPRFHNRPDPLFCPQCPNKAYHGHDRITNLKRHNRETHQKVQFPCPSCHKDFSRQANLIRHQRSVHKGER